MAQSALHKLRRAEPTADTFGADPRRLLESSATCSVGPSRELPPGSQRRHVIPDLVEALYQHGRPADTGVLIQELEGGDDADRATAVILRVLVEPISPTSSVEATRAALESAGLHVEASDPVSVSRFERAPGWPAMRSSPMMPSCPPTKSPSRWAAATSCVAVS